MFFLPVPILEKSHKQRQITVEQAVRNQLSENRTDAETRQPPPGLPIPYWTTATPSTICVPPSR